MRFERAAYVLTYTLPNGSRWAYFAEGEIAGNGAVPPSPVYLRACVGDIQPGDYTVEIERWDGPPRYAPSLVFAAAGDLFPWEEHARLIPFVVRIEANDRRREYEVEATCITAAMTSGEPAVDLAVLQRFGLSPKVSASPAHAIDVVEECAA